MGFIWMIIVGLVAGLLARAIKPGNDAMGWIMTIVLGIVGAILGGFIAGLIGIDADGGFTGLIFSVIGAIILLFLYEMIMNRRRLK
ncbi:GlsB/YeaQ/YmgE family stress response membrane protein [Psychrobacter sp. DM4]|uniref:GlsB/YeaQ/YmgE family stress response membrane protein n=1 Tax=Psychrobacter sp. DM4 TaxID=3440637 RepID=UPI003F4F5639